MHFSDFQIRAWQVDDKHVQVMVQSSPAGDMRRPVSVSSDRDVMRDRARSLGGKWMGKTLDDVDVVGLGEQLAEILLPRPVRALLSSSLEGLSPGEGLRLRLCLDEPLVDLPWEFLRYSGAGEGGTLAGFLILDPRLSLVREAPATSLVLRPSAEAQRLLFAAAVVQMRVGLEPMLTYGAEEELQRLREGLEPLDAFLSIESITADGDHVEVALSRPAAIFHYTGTTGVIGGRACLAKEHHDGPAGYLYSETLGGMLREARTRLAVLSADYSGRWPVVEPFLRAGLPALIGAQGTLDPQAYIAFCGRLYASLAVGLSLDESVIGARLHLLATRGQSDFHWGGFMVYMPSTEAVLFPRPDDLAVRERQDAARREVDRTVGDLDPLIRAQAQQRARLDKRALRKAIVRAFNSDELAVLCADVEQDLAEDGFPFALSLEVVGGGSLERVVSELIDYLDRRGVVEYLVAAVRRERLGLL